MNEDREHTEYAPEYDRREFVLILPVVVEEKYHCDQQQPYCTEGIVVSDAVHSRWEKRIEQRTDTCIYEVGLYSV